MTHHHDDHHRNAATTTKMEHTATCSVSRLAMRTQYTGIKAEKAVARWQQTSARWQQTSARWQQTSARHVCVLTHGIMLES